jgi:hypothetical protein
MAAVAPQVCADEPGFDRASFKQRFNREVTAFFRRRLGRK